MISDSSFETSMSIIWTLRDDPDLKWTALYSYYVALIDLNKNDVLHDRISEVLFLMGLATQLEKLEDDDQWKDWNNKR